MGGRKNPLPPPPPPLHLGRVLFTLHLGAFQVFSNGFLNAKASARPQISLVAEKICPSPVAGSGVSVRLGVQGICWG